MRPLSRLFILAVAVAAVLGARPTRLLAAATASGSARSPMAWSHTPVDVAQPGRALAVRVTMPVIKGVRVYLLYRRGVTGSFTEVPMRRVAGDKVARIPAVAMNGKSVQYYIEARDPAGSILRSWGGPRDPNVVRIDASARPTAPETPEEIAARNHTDLDDEAAPLTQAQADAAARKQDQAAAAQQQQQRNDSAPRARKPLGTWFWVGLAGSVAGAALIGTASWAGVQARDFARAVGDDSSFHYYFRDPTVAQDDAYFERQGKLHQTLTIALGTIGGVLLAGGITAIIVDRVGHAPRREQASAGRWWAAPSLGPGSVGVGAGVTF